MRTRLAFAARVAGQADVYNRVFRGLHPDLHHVLVDLNSLLWTQRKVECILMMGQIYLATLIARLVGLHIAHSLKKG